MIRSYSVIMAILIIVGCSESSDTSQAKAEEQGATKPLSAMVSIEAFAKKRLDGVNAHMAASKVKSSCMSDLNYNQDAMAQMAKTMSALSLEETYSVSDLTAAADPAEIEKKVVEACEMNNKSIGWDLPDDRRLSSVQISSGLGTVLEDVDKPDPEVDLLSFPLHVGQLYACAARNSDQKLADVTDKFGPMIEDYRALVSGHQEPILDPNLYDQNSSFPEEQRVTWSTVTVDDPANIVLLGASMVLASDSDAYCRNQMPYLMSQLGAKYEYTEKLINQSGG